MGQAKWWSLRRIWPGSGGRKPRCKTESPSHRLTAATVPFYKGAWAGGAHPRVASLGLRPIHLQPLPYGFQENLPGVSRGGPWASRRDAPGTPGDRKGRPYGDICAGSGDWETQTQKLDRTDGKFPPTQGPGGPGRNRRQALLALCAGNFAELLRSVPRKWGPGAANMSAERSS